MIQYKTNKPKTKTKKRKEKKENCQRKKRKNWIGLGKIHAVKLGRICMGETLFAFEDKIKDDFRMKKCSPELALLVFFLCPALF